jgi:hypothetical protein
MKKQPRMRAKDVRALAAIIRHARKNPDPLLMHADAALELAGYGQVRLFHISHPALIQKWQFGYFKPDASEEEFALPCWASFEDFWSIRAIDLQAGRLAINADALRDLVSSAPAFLHAVLLRHGINPPRNHPRTPWK